MSNSKDVSSFLQTKFALKLMFVAKEIAPKELCASLAPGDRRLCDFPNPSSNIQQSNNLSVSQTIQETNRRTYGRRDIPNRLWTHHDTTRTERAARTPCTC